jgi:hypothetical protein
MNNAFIYKIFYANGMPCREVRFWESIYREMYGVLGTCNKTVTFQYKALVSDIVIISEAMETYRQS